MQHCHWSSIFTSREYLYTETGWQTLQNRRYTAKIVTMFKIHNGGAPSYLNDRKGCDLLQGDKLNEIANYIINI